MKKRNKFSLSHYRLTSFDMGKLVPIMFREVVPGDTFQQKTDALLRCSPLLAPVMHPVHVHIKHVYTPYRILWSGFEDFITGGADGNDATVYPTISLTNVAVGSLANHLGIPVGFTGTTSALPFRAYALFFNEYIRDEDLVTEIGLSTGSGTDSTTNTTLQNVAWEKDYFTSSRPWAQKGTAVTLPIGTTAPVKSDGNGISMRTNTGAMSTVNSLGGAGNNLYLNTASGGSGQVNWGASGASTTGLYTDLANATGISIGDFREALALQRFKERSALHGSRFTEYLRATFGVASSDARLQRPEILGGGKQTIQFSEVIQTAEGTDPVGDLKGHGIAAASSNRYRAFFEEPGCVITYMYVRPKTVYTSGIQRAFNRRTRFDFLQPEFEHVGQQEVLNKEVYHAHSTPDGTFGFQDRFDEYRRAESEVSGEFATSALNHFHFARDFSSDPTLNSTFVQCVPTERTFAVPGNDVLWVMAHHSIQARRPLAAHANPYTY